MKMNYSYNEMERAFECGRNFQLTGENNFKELIEELNQALHQLPVMPRFLPQPSDIEKLMKEKLKTRKINDEFGWTGEWRMSAKDIIDVIIDLQHRNNSNSIN